MRGITARSGIDHWLVRVADAGTASGAGQVFGRRTTGVSAIAGDIRVVARAFAISAAEFTVVGCRANA